ncbi:hypothetical protein ACIBTV_27475 [Micromonospora sp. NPDC049366]|uniref:hypothetical protein n=1 Tax=Micromonospora sp. NPDC049366 TaxID=3364271 RepID=UPI0037BC6719
MRKTVIAAAGVLLVLLCGIGAGAVTRQDGQAETEPATRDGGAAGGVVGLLAVVLVAWWLVRRSRRRG